MERQMPNDTRSVAPMAAGRALHLNVRHLEVFWAIMRSGNQHEAARLLGLSQPAVSKVLRYTEDRIGVPLFRRIKGRLQPTHEAEVFFRAVDDIFSRLDAAERLARDLQRRLTGQVTLTTIAAFNASLVPGALGAFLRSQPLVRAGLKVLTPAEVVERVANSQADLGLTFGPVDPALVDTHLLCTVPVVCAVPIAHRLARRVWLTPSDLDGERLITASERPPWGKMIEEAFAAAGIKPLIAVECTQPDLAFAMAEAGVGIAIVPSIPVRADTTMAVSVCLFQPAISVPIVAVTHSGRPAPQSIETLISQLRLTTQTMQWPEHLLGRQLSTAERLIQEPAPLPAV
jgi:DNA-binding transcriptional LysR family regulator